MSQCFEHRAPSPHADLRSSCHVVVRRAAAGPGVAGGGELVDDHVGWDGYRRVHGSVIHIDVIDEKIWVQHDGTSPGVAVDLAETGIPRDAIVLAFHPPYVRRGPRPAGRRATWSTARE